MRTLPYTCEQAQGFLNEALESRSRTLESLKYAIENSRNSQRMLERSNLAAINKDIERWESVCMTVCNIDQPLDMKQGLPIR